jgi:hypothetical protein
VKVTSAQAQHAEKMNSSVIREILKATEKPGIISFAALAGVFKTHMKEQKEQKA